MATVPSQYQPYINQAAQGTGLPVSVVAAQASMESGFNPNAVSPTNAEGFWQFEPATYDAVAGAAGVPANTEFNVADETKAYIVYMNELLKQEGGSVFKALEAYNAGPGNLPAGATYASNILSNAGVPQNVSSSSATLTSFNPLDLLPGNISGLLNLLPGSGGVANTLNGITNTIFGSIGSMILKDIGVPNTKDLFQRLGLILLGVVLVIVGLTMLVKSPATKIVNMAGKVAPEAAALLWVTNFIVCLVIIRSMNRIPASGS